MIFPTQWQELGLIPLWKMPVEGTGPGTVGNRYCVWGAKVHKKENEGIYFQDGGTVQGIPAEEPCHRGQLSKAIAAMLKESQQVTLGRFKIDATLLQHLLLLGNS